MWNLKDKMKQSKTTTTTKQPQRYREHVSDCQRQGVGETVKWVRVVKRYKPPVMKQMSWDVAYSLVTS